MFCPQEEITISKSEFFYKRFFPLSKEQRRQLQTDDAVELDIAPYVWGDGDGPMFLPQHRLSLTLGGDTVPRILLYKRDSRKEADRPAAIRELWNKIGKHTGLTPIDRTVAVSGSGSAGRNWDVQTPLNLGRTRLILQQLSADLRNFERFDKSGIYQLTCGIVSLAVGLAGFIALNVFIPVYIKSDESLTAARSFLNDRRDAALVEEILFGSLVIPTILVFIGVGVLLAPYRKNIYIRVIIGDEPAGTLGHLICLASILGIIGILANSAVQFVISR
jgi:hypothetical protein